MRYPSCVALVATLLAPAVALAQAEPIAGRWSGVLDTPSGKLPLLFHIKPDGSATLDSPAQKAVGRPARATFNDGKARLELAIGAASFEGALSADGKTLQGQWRQGGGSAPLIMTRTAAPRAQIARPQTPKPPFPYRAQDVTYRNPASGLDLAGTLTLPPGAGPFAAALLITGSGPQDRDETIFGHKPFLLIADALTRRGVAVLRVDDRGVGGSAAGDAAKATTADFATDVEAGVAFLRGRPDIDPARIGLIGHSEGGMIGPMVAAGDPRIAFVVLLAGPGVDGRRLLLSQGEALERAAGASDAAVRAASAQRGSWFDAVLTEPDDAKAQAKLTALLDAQKIPPAARPQVLGLTAPWWRYALAFQPARYLKDVRAPVLAVGGGKDLQVPAAENLAAIKAALPAGTEAEIRALPGLNHLLQTARTGVVAEYGQIEETLAPAALDLIVDWTVRHAGPGR